MLTKSKMSPKRQAKRIFLLLGGAALGCLIFFFGSIYFLGWLRDRMTGGYWSFLEKKRSYYVEFAKACDAIIASHPLGTNSFIEIPKDDLTVPTIIRDLGPSKIKCASNRVWMLIGTGNGDFGIVWEPEPEGQTNIWAITTAVENLLRIPYLQTNCAVVNSRTSK